ncbi:Formate dehydrogenase major subunit [Dirofilaria immitis]|nr:hypothetical protein [Dirofilaria immitis]
MWDYKLLVILLIIQFYSAQQQRIDNFPNPRTNGYNKCGLKSKGYVCDPDKQLSEQERYRLNNDLLQLSRRTSVDQSADFCITKGVDATLFITKEGNEQLAHQLNTVWAIDGQCKKSLVFVLSTIDHRLYYSADERAPISANSFKTIVSEYQELLNEGKFTTALTSIFMKLGESIQDNNKERIKPDNMHERENSTAAPEISTFAYFMIISLIALQLPTA